MRVLITGGNGFIGRHFTDLLVNSHIEYIQCGNLLTQADIHYEQCDIHNTHKISQLLKKYHPTHLVHFAWTTGKHYASALENIHWITSTFHLVSEFYNQNGKRFIGIGTCFEYKNTDQARKEEDTPTLPSTLYGKSKLAVANYIDAFATANNVSYAWCRPFYISGPGEAARRLVPSACLALMDNKIFYTGAYHNILDYMDVRDVAQAILSVMQSDYTGTINIATGNGTHIKDMMKTLEKIIPSRGCIQPLIDCQKPHFIIANADILHNIIGFKEQYAFEKTATDYYEYIKGLR